MIPAAAEVAIFRVVQEALVNVQKHARAQRVDVRLARHGGHLLVEVRDNGIGLSTAGRAMDSLRLPLSEAKGSPQDGAGTGLRSMRERAELFGGALALESPDGAGTHVMLRIPAGAQG